MFSEEFAKESDFNCVVASIINNFFIKLVRVNINLLTKITYETD
jgi:hypothetical protein